MNGRPCAVARSTHRSTRKSLDPAPVVGVRGATSETGERPVRRSVGRSDGEGPKVRPGELHGDGPPREALEAPLDYGEVVVEAGDLDATRALGCRSGARNQRVQRDVLVEQLGLFGLAERVVLQRVHLAPLDAGLRQHAGVPARSAQCPTGGVDGLARAASQAEAEEALGGDIDGTEEAGVARVGQRVFYGVPLGERLTVAPDEP